MDCYNAENPCRNEEDFLAWRVLRRIGAVGLLWNRNSTAFLGIGLDAERRRQAFAGLEAAGAILPAAVEGIKTPFYFLSEDEPLMRAVLAGTHDKKPRMEFIAPLDPMLWDKDMVAAIWDYRYSWEIYTPADKRKYGYYTLPILWGERFIGRIVTSVDRKNAVLLVKNVWLEPGVRSTKKLQSALDRTLARFAAFNDCTSVEVCE